MTKDLIRPRGHMTLTLYDAQGNQTAEYAQPNSVMQSGKAMLLNLLKGDHTVSGYELILGAKGFKPNEANPLSQPTAIPVKLNGAVSKKIEGQELVVGFRGNIEGEGAIVGGGMVVNAKKSGNDVRSLYNFATTPSQIEMTKDQSVSVTFRLAME